jgi:hypothetical protein
MVVKEGKKLTVTGRDPVKNVDKVEWSSRRYGHGGWTPRGKTPLFGGVSGWLMMG